MEVMDILESFEDALERGLTIPFTTKCIIDKEDMIEIIQEMRLKIPDEMKQAKWVSEERKRILAEAQEESENIVKNAENKIQELIDEHEITKKAYEQAEIIISGAKKNAREIRLGTREYADSILNKVEEILEDTVDVIKVNREELK